MKAIAEPNRIEAEKRRKKRVKIATVLGVLVIALVAIFGYVWYCMQPLDRILDYQVSVTPQADGSMEITYNIRWEVLNDSREGPLTWVKIGMANEEFEVVDYGGAIFKPTIFPDPYYAEFTLTRSFYQGEIADFWFTVRQKRMLCRDSENAEQVFYDFTPGWFNAIEVEHYLFTWHDPIGARSANADRQFNSDFTWEGALPKGGACRMKVFYSKQDFPNAATVQWYPTSTHGGDSPEGPNGSVIILILLVAGFVELQIWSNGNAYRRGRGFNSRHYGHGHHGGGGCACACAGCACACACAGGGRAGCSNKDFYQNEEPE